MKALKKIHITAFFFLSLFFVSGFIAAFPGFADNIIAKNYLQQAAENTSGNAEETIEKEEVKVIYILSDNDINFVITRNSIIPVTDEQCMHLFTPSIIVPPPERIS